MTIRSLFLCCLGLCLICFQAHAFVVYGPQNPVDAHDNLERAPRWAVTDSPMVDGGDRGLGGGLEYAIDNSICQIRFNDGASCSDAKLAIAQALNVWSTGHPLLFFADVSDVVAAAKHDPETIGHRGAEIDFFADDRRDFRVFRDGSITGHTVFFERRDTAFPLTNGSTARRPMARIESADVRLNRELCYYIDVRKASADCIHFPSVVLHEISHVLGIAHPEEFPELNLDSDAASGNEILIDCNAPLRGLVQSSEVDPAAVSHGHDVQNHGRYVRGLTWDDVAARDALYPNCGIVRFPRFSRSWGAFALGQDGSAGRARMFLDQAAAGADAKAQCEQSGTVCVVMETFDDCFALAVSPSGSIGMATSARTDLARDIALNQCSAEGGDCILKADFCAFETERR